MEIWSLTRFPEDNERAKPDAAGGVGDATIRAGRRSPTQDFSNLPRQQKGLHAQGFEYMRLSERIEGHVSNFERTDRRLPRRPAPTTSCSRRSQPSTCTRFEQPIVDLGF